jgi:tetratricopeptide (TPR) repeat protein
MKRLSFLVALALAGPAPTHAQGQGQGQDGSLEAFLERVRSAGEAERERLRPLVEDVVQRLGRARTSSEVQKLQAELDALGSEAPSLVATYLDPGPDSKPEAEKQAQEAAAWLERHPDSALFEGLAALARQGSPLGRRLAIRLLGTTPESERALETLRALHAELGGPLRAECVRSLARLDPEEPLLVASLADTHPEVAAAAVRALANEPRKRPRPEVIALLEDQNRGADVLSELVAYLSFPGQSVEEEAVAALLRYAGRADLPVTARLGVLEGVPRFTSGVTTRMRKEFDALVASPESAVRDGALIALTLLKDSRARRELMRPFDEQVQTNENWPLAYQRRAEVLFKIGEYRDATRDYLDAIRLHGDVAKLPANRELWVSLARAQLRDGKLKAAAETLDEFGLPSDLRKSLRADPDFRPLVEHAKYRELFE